MVPVNKNRRRENNPNHDNNHRRCRHRGHRYRQMFFLH